MSKMYRIEGPGDEKSFLEASAMANEVVTHIAGVGGSTNVLTWLSYVLSASGAAAASVMLFRPVLETFPAVPTGAALFLAILTGVALYLIALVVLNRWIGNGTARAYINDPMMQNHHVMLSEEGMRVVSGQTHTLFHWADVTRIDVTANVTLVTAGMAWVYIPVANFADQEQAKAAIADMRAWQAAARA